MMWPVFELGSKEGIYLTVVDLCSERVKIWLFKNKAKSVLDYIVSQFPDFIPEEMIKTFQLFQI